MGLRGLLALKIKVKPRQTQRFHQAKPIPTQHASRQGFSLLHSHQHRAHLRGAHHHGQAWTRFRPDHSPRAQSPSPNALVRRSHDPWAEPSRLALPLLERQFRLSHS